MVKEAGQQFIGYLIPAPHEAAAPFTFVVLDLNGKMAWQKPVTAEEDKIREPEDRKAAILEAIGPGKEIVFAEQTFVVTDNGQRIAYLLGGKFPGFKTFISVMVALDPKYRITSYNVCYTKLLRTP